MRTPLLIALSLFIAAPALADGPIEVDVPEPSGIDVDRAGERVFVVDDGGELWVFDEDFAPIDVFDVGGDLEGVVYLPRQERLLIASEGVE